MSKPLHRFPKGIKAALWQRMAGTRLRSCTAPAETVFNFSIVTRVKRNIPFTQTRSRMLQTVLLHSYNHHASDVWSRVAALVTISPVVIANRDCQEQEQWWVRALLCIGSCCSQGKPKDIKTLSELCVTVTPSHSVAFTCPGPCIAGWPHPWTTRLCCNTGRISRYMMLPGSTTGQAWIPPGWV